MALNRWLLAEFEMEAGRTRRVLERIPEDKLSWAPHAKSMTLGHLARHVAEIPGWMVPTLEQDALDMAGFTPPPDPKSRGEVLATFEKSVEAGRKALAAANDDAKWDQNWSLKAGEQTFFTAPRMMVARGFVFDHMIHHRGQLSVYLRLNDVPVPSIYGPSADEQAF